MTSDAIKPDCGCIETYPQLVPGKVSHGPGCALSAELERLREFQRKTEEAEARCCPEDVGFEEWIGVLTKRLDAASSAKASAEPRSVESYQCQIKALHQVNAELREKLRFASSATRPTYADIAGAVARGWCSPNNAHKEMDSELAFAISVQIAALLGLGKSEHRDDSSNESSSTTGAPK